MTKTRIINEQSSHLPLEVVHNGAKISSPNLITVRVGNVGKIEIKDTDFDGPAQISFPTSRILAGTDRGPLKRDEIVRKRHSVEFTPTMLNIGEWIEFQFVTDGDLESPTIEARVAGQKGSLVDVAQSRRKLWAPVVYVAMGLLSLGFSALVVFRDSLWVAPALVGIMAGAAVMFVAAKRSSRTAVWIKNPEYTATNA